MRRLLTIFILMGFITLNAQVDIFDSAYDTIIISEIDEITIEGIRSDSKTPISKKILTFKDIDINSYSQELPLLLDRTPNITSSTDGGHNQGYTYFRLRGIDQTRINMTLEGVPLNEPEDQGVYFSNFPDFSNSIKSMEIQRGVGTSSNGVASYGGSINFEALKGTEKPGTEVQLGYGSFNTKKYSIEHSTGLLKNKTSFYVRVSDFGTDGYKDHSGNSGSSVFVSGNYYGESDIINVILFTGGCYNQMSWFAVDKETIENNPRTNYNTEREYDNFYQSMALVKYKKLINKHNNFTTTLFYNRLDGDWRLENYWMLSYRVDNNWNDGENLNIYQLKSNFYGIIYNYNYKTKDLKVNLGINGNIYERTHFMNIEDSVEIGNEIYRNTGYKYDLSSYLKVGYDINRLTLFSDLQLRNTMFRYDGDYTMDNMSWTFFNPKGGLMYNFTNKINVYGFVGNSHREPTRTDIFVGEDEPTTHIDIKPEEVLDYELGVNLKYNKVVGQFNLYYMDFNNEITLLGALGSNSLPLMTNVENSFRSGVELDLIYKPNDILRFGFNSAYSENKINDGGKLFEPLYTPKLIFNGNVGINDKEDKYSLRLETKYHSESYINWDNTMVTPSFYVFNAQLKISMEKYSLFLRMNNIFDKLYYTNGYADYSSLGLTEFYFVNPPRNFMITLKIFFDNVKYEKPF
jgi:iron complex outermembrane recepter protein